MSKKLSYPLLPGLAAISLALLFFYNFWTTPFVAAQGDTTPTPSPQPDITPVACNMLTAFRTPREEVYYHQQKTLPVLDVYLVNPDGSEATRLLRTRERGEFSGKAGWSPDGTKLVYQIWDIESGGGRVYIMFSFRPALMWLYGMPAKSGP